MDELLLKALEDLKAQGGEQTQEPDEIETAAFLNGDYLA